MDKRSQNLHEESKRVIIQYALFRWENALIIAGTIILTAFYSKPFPWWPIWGWPLIGMIGVGLIFFSSLRNTETNAELLMKSFQESFDLRKIQLPELREKVTTALKYQRRIDAYVWEQGDSLLWDQAQDTANQIQTWVKNVYQLGCHLDAYRRDTLIHEELGEIPKEVAALESQQRQGIEANLIDDFTQLLESKRNHLETLHTLDAKMKQAALQLDHSISSLATVDSQIRLIAAQDVDNSRSERLRADIQEQVDRLNDLIASIEEVYEA